MTTEYIGCWKVLYDWQTLLAGLLALGAGVLAYCAAQRQAHATEEQTRQLQRENKRQLAREGIVASRLLDGVLSTLQDDVRSLQKVLAQPSYAEPNATIPPSYKEHLSKPPLATVWEKLGRSSPDFITNYMNLDAGVESFRTTQIFGAAWHITELEKFAVIVTALREMLGEQGRRAHDAILETEP